MKLATRQVHLDFHTSGLIRDIGSRFSKAQFLHALQLGHVNSITVFSKCHHGYAFHPTAVHQMHPHLSFDLLGEQLAACREAGVKAPVYISAGFDEKEAVVHPEWLARNEDDTPKGRGFLSGAGYHLLCYNTGYMDLLIAQIEEVMQRYNPCGIFLDISSVRPCHCAACRGRLLREGKDPRKPEHVMELAQIVYAEYVQKVEAAVRRYSADATIFHNAGNITRGRRDLAHANTHLELESLPTGGWGYDHFPLSAAYVSTLGMEYLGMTGKFHTTWGEFGGFKHPNALRYEAALSIAMGAKCSIGDQLHPLGDMNLSTYRLIGEAYADIEQKEPWCADSAPVADIAVLSSEAVNARLSSHRDGSAPDIGANRILLEGKYLYQFIDAEQELAPYKLLILPDDVRLEEALAKKIRAYLAKGGRVLATGTSGLRSDADEFALDLGIRYEGKAPCQPSYFTPGFPMTNGNTAYVMYGTAHAVAQEDARIIGWRQDSYFNRDTFAFCSHQHTPNDPTHSAAAVFMQANTAYIAWDVFTDYARKGSLHLKELCVHVIDTLLGQQKTLTAALPDRGIVTLRRQKGRLICHLLYAHTTVRGEGIEVIEDVVPLHDIKVTLRCDAKPARVLLVPQNEELPFTWEQGTVRLSVPRLHIHQMISLEMG